MSGPLPASADAVVAFPTAQEPPRELEVVDGTTAVVGRFRARRSLPRRVRRTVGNWCFVDHLGPGTVTADHGLDVAPHPHIGLQTVTWLLEGGILHRDSLGTEQRILPGQLNLMTAGRGVSHSEETAGVSEGTLHGLQLWLALPVERRDIEPAFEHHAELPVVALDAGTATRSGSAGRATVIVGELAGTASPARRDSPAVAADLELDAGRAVVPLDPAWEHALVVADGPPIAVGDRALHQGQLGYLGVGHDEVVIDASALGRVLLIGGEPRHDPLVMWWNYVAPTREEILLAHRDWTDQSPRFGTVASPLPRVTGPEPPWAH